MSLHKYHDDNHSFIDFNHEEDSRDLSQKRHIRKMIEDRLERKRLKDELEDELSGEFDWSDLDR